MEYGLIRTIKTTTAAVHDSQIDLSIDGERVYRDKGYFGAFARGRSVTMYRATRNHPLSSWDRMRNVQISRIRAPGERPFAISLTGVSESFDKVETSSRPSSRLLMCL